MDFSGLGGGVMVALAATLWIAYLTPSWFRRKEYLATERNAVRLQQTLRVLAETTEVPETVRAETTARDAVAHARRLREEQLRLEAIRKARDASAIRQREHNLRQTQPTLAAALAATTRSARLRRGRLASALLLLASLATVGIQLSVSLTTGIVTGAFVVLSVALVGTATAFGMLNRLQTVGRSLATTIAGVDVERRVSPKRVPVTPPVQQKREWTPVPIPKPLYIAQPAPEARVAVGLVVDPAPVVGGRVAQPLETAVAELKAATAAAEHALREAHASPEIAPFERPAASKYASMGIVETTDTPATDLDAVLRRRRAAG